MTINKHDTYSTATIKRASGLDWFGLFSICIGLIIVTADLSVADAVLPDIVGDFNISGQAASFVISIYMLSSACLLIPAGKLADRIGSRRVFVLGMATFAAGSLICGIAPDYPVFLAGRFVQACGYALTFPAALAMVNMQFPEGQCRTLAFAIIAVTIGAALGGGPMIGGVVARAGEWDWVFTANTPLALLAGAGCLAAMPAHVKPRRDHGFDAVGLILLIASQAMLFGGIQLATRAGWLLTRSDYALFGMPWPLPISPTLPLICASLALGWLFVRMQRRRERVGRSVIVEVSIFESRKFSWAFLAASAMTAGVFGVLYVLPLFVEYVLGMNLSGALVAAMGAGMVIGGLASKPLVNRFGMARLTPAALLLQVAAPLVAAAVLHEQASPASFIVGLFLQGASWSLAYAVLQNTMLSNVPKELSAVASGVGLMGRLFAGAIATAFIASTLYVVAALETRRLDTSGLSAEQSQEIQHAYEFTSVLKLPVTHNRNTIAELRQETRFQQVIEEAKHGMVLALRIGLLITALVNFLGLVAVLQIWRKRPPEAQVLQDGRGAGSRV